MTVVYSKRIARFLAEVRQLAKNVQLRCMPQFVVYNDKKMLGYFDPNFRQIGLHERLLNARWDVVKNVVLHELAHALTYERYGAHVLPHGEEFRACCRARGWGREVYSATTCLDDAVEENEQEESPILRRVQKLMALGESRNPHEAELAMLKAQELLLKHNLEAEAVLEEGEKFYLKQVLTGKKSTAKWHAIAKILETFFVSVVYKMGRGSVGLEILGTKVNVEIAEYVGQLLDREMERFWELAQKREGLRGVVAKHSFFRGIALGYCEKVERLKRGYGEEATRALMVLEGQLEEARRGVYPRLRQTVSRHRHSPEAAEAGKAVGRGLNFKPGVGSGAQRSPLAIGCK